MPRIARNITNGTAYHVLNRGNGKREVFRKKKDYQSFIDLVKQAKIIYPLKILAYCIMPTHFHLILIQQQREHLSNFMRWLMTTFVRRYHNFYKTSGHIWQGRFKSFPIENSYLYLIARYVERNPVNAGYVDSARQWQWSSHQERIGDIPNNLIDKTFLKVPPKWNEYVDTLLTAKELENIHKSILRQSPFGSDSWQQQVARKLGLESTLRPRGRPK